MDILKKRQILPKYQIIQETIDKKSQRYMELAKYNAMMK